jgi:hypothetical protein
VLAALPADSPWRNRILIALADLRRSEANLCGYAIAPPISRRSELGCRVSEVLEMVEAADL